MAEIEINLEIRNIGPHKELMFNTKTKSLKISIYANNGTGKTFISRLFRLIENPTQEKSNKLLSFGSSNGNFKFSVKNGNLRELDIKITKNSNPLIENKTGYIFHTFNSDYISENIIVKNYNLDGSIEGYIVGKTQIDLSKDKELLKEKELLKSKNTDELKSVVNSKKNELNSRELNINKNTTEYVRFDFENIFMKSSFGYSENSNFDELKKQNSKLDKLPEDLMAVPIIEDRLKENYLDSIKGILLQKYDQSKMDEKFRLKIKSKQQFIEFGLKLINDDKCPFCEQNFGEAAIKIIQSYRDFLKDTEAQINSQLDLKLKDIKEYREIIEQSYIAFNDSYTAFEKLKKYLPTFEKKSLKEPLDKKELFKSLDELEEIVINKKKDITKAYDIGIIVTDLKDKIEIINKTTASNNKIIEELNSRRENINIEKLELKRRLCISKYVETLSESEEKVDFIRSLEQEILQLKSEIEEKENKIKTSRKDKVIKTFEELLDVFFSNKYTFDKNNNCLQFGVNKLLDNASDVLSDGEKSIVAFCYYLAETHLKINSESDYPNLFFIIDDPISSLDFHYVYSIAQLIRRLNKNNNFSLGDRYRFLLLTHNIEFMSILIRNKIINGRFTLYKSLILELKNELILPYEEHLRDIYNVSVNRIGPNHNTPNSLRHILETINKFERPDLDFLSYCEALELFDNDNEFLYSLIHDNSHGNMRLQKAYTEDMVVKGCKKVIEIIEKKFSGQLKVINTN